MCSGHSHVALPIHSIVGPKSRDTFQNAVPNCRISHGRVNDQVYNTVIVIVRISNDECSRIDSLAETSADLTKTCISLKGLLVPF
jgi:hypothetical protein